MKNLYEMMRTINKLMNKGVTHLNINDIEYVFGYEANEDMKQVLEYLDCKVVRVADLFNVTLPEKKFTREELNRQKRIETMYANL